MSAKIERFDVSDDDSSAVDEEDDEIDDDINIELSLDVNADADDDHDEFFNSKMRGFNNIDDDVCDDELEVFYDSENQTSKSNILNDDKKSVNKKETGIDKIPNQSSEAADDVFNISYKPYKKKTIQAQPNYNPYLHDEEYQETIVKLTKCKQIDGQNLDDDEFDFETIEVPANAKSNSNSTDAKEKAYDQFYDETNFCSDGQPLPTSSTGTDISTEPTVTAATTDIASQPKFNVWSAAASSLSEIKSVYGDGLGDVEVRILNNSEDPNVVTQTGIGATDIHTITEEDEDEYEKQEMMEALQIEQKILMQSQEAAVWDNIANQSSDWSSTNEIKKNAANEPSISKTVTQITDLCKAVPDIGNCTSDGSYSQTLKYLKQQDLSYLSPLIVTSDRTDDQPTGSSSTDSWLSKGLRSLIKSHSKSIIEVVAFSDYQNELDFPFLVAQLDYNSDNINHLSCLRHIYLKLTKTNTANQQQLYQSIPALGLHWDDIGFQGLDPRTDLNRSMKMLTILLTLHMIDTEDYLSAKIFALSIFGRETASSSSRNNSSSRRGGNESTDVDYTWPFMCVSVLFTKETIQTLRAGHLNKYINERNDVLSVVADFHHASFLAFGQSLVDNPKKHHAMHLADLRKLTESDPHAVLKPFLNLKTSKFPQRILDGLLTHTKIQTKNTSSTRRGNNSNSNEQQSEDEDIGMQNTFLDITAEVQVEDRDFQQQETTLRSSVAGMFGTDRMSKFKL